MLLLEVLTGAASLAILAPVLILLTEVLAALVSKESEPILACGQWPRLAVVIPAHNEALVVRDTLQYLLPQLRSGDRVVVVADNCTDETAAIAAAAGAEVSVRHDESRRGKGYALDRGIRYLESAPPDVILILDADCRIAQGSVDRLALICAQTGRPAQALNLSYAPPGAGVKVHIAEFASTLKNRVRALGMRNLGLPCHLTGTGMAFPWACIRQARLATGHIVEDIKLGLELISAGHPPLFCPEARVSSSFPASDEGFNSQRTRWEHGYLGVLLQDAPAVIKESLARRDGRLLAVGLDLCVPPIYLLALLVAAVWAASALGFALVHLKLPLFIASAAAGLLGLSVWLSWVRYGRESLSLYTLALALVYALRKIPFYARFLVNRQLDWVRTRRD